MWRHQPELRFNTSHLATICWVIHDYKKIFGKMWKNICKNMFWNPESWRHQKSTFFHYLTTQKSDFFIVFQLKNYVQQSFRRWTLILCKNKNDFSKFSLFQNDHQNPSHFKWWIAKRKAKNQKIDSFELRSSNFVRI